MGLFTPEAKSFEELEAQQEAAVVSTPVVEVEECSVVDPTTETAE